MAFIPRLTFRQWSIIADMHERSGLLQQHRNLRAAQQQLSVELARDMIEHGFAVTRATGEQIERIPPEIFRPSIKPVANDT